MKISTEEIEKEIEKEIDEVIYKGLDEKSRKVFEQAEAILLVSQLEVRKQLKESGASEAELAELDEQQPISYSEERIEELKKIAEEMLSTREKGEKT